MPNRNCYAWAVVAILSASAGCASGTGTRLAGFEVSQHWSEQIKEIACEPGVRVHINAPSESQFDAARPTLLVFYALPNGNSIEWTIGRQKAEGLDWHYYIQHIGAQTRRLRETIHDRNIVIAYVEAQGRSWPTWRKKHENGSQIIAGVIEEVVRQVGVRDPAIILSAHSGGGSFIFGYLEGLDRIPDNIHRIAFLDANYSFSDEAGHGAKLVDWLKRGTDKALVVVAYDDREITFDGKKVVGPTGGTYRATGRMLDSFKGKLALAESIEGDCIRHRGLDGRVDIIVHRNPKNVILHTVLVGDMNGFIHAMTTGTPHENKAGLFGGPIAYHPWIQPN